MQHYRDFNICLQNQTYRHNRVNKMEVNVEANQFRVDGSVTGLFVIRHKQDRCRIDAITQASWLRPIGKYMT